jgi:ribonuclease D
MFIFSNNNTSYTNTRQKYQNRHSGHGATRRGNFNEIKPKEFFQSVSISPYIPKFENCLISNNEDLEKALNSFLDNDKVFIMIEKQKENSYDEAISTIQISNKGRSYIIDMMSESVDIQAIKNFIMYDKIQKIVYDVEDFFSCIYTKYGQIPANVFDVKIAAMLCGIEKRYQYRQMLCYVLGKNYKIKDSTKMNYKQRPLSAKAIDRAILNVMHLEDLYNFIHRDIVDFGRLEMHNEILSEMTSPDLYIKDPKNSWLKIKFHTDQMDVARRVNSLENWRVSTARKMNLNPKLVMSDKVLVEIAEKNPTSHDELSSINNISKMVLKFHAKEVISAVIAAQKLILEKTDLETDMIGLPSKYIPLVDILKIVLRIRAGEHKISPKLIASNSDLAIIADSKSPHVKCLKGWRYDVFGKEALKIRNGKAVLFYENNNLTIVDEKIS